MAELAVGKLAPRWRLPSDGGGEVDIAALRGRPVVLFFYPQDDTETCTREALSFSALSEGFAAAGAALIGISPDPVRKHDRFKLKYGLQLTLVSDEDHGVAAAYGVWREKTTFGRTYMGVERSTFLVRASGRIARIWRNVRVAGHAEEVLQAVQHLQGRKST